ncbi:MAG: hypothetical protein NVSMB23_24160 [Myxococcales bacterium]
MSNRLNRALTPLFVLAAASCSHGQRSSAPSAARSSPKSPVQLDPDERDPQRAARILSDEAHGVLRAEGELFWARYTTGAGALPSSAADDHGQLFSASSLSLLAGARAAARGSDLRAWQLLYAWIAPLAVTRTAAGPIDALDRARAALTYAVPGDASAARGERDLDRLLTDEPSAARRAAIAESEAAAARALVPLAFARGDAEAQALASLGLPAWPALIEELFGETPGALAQLAEATLAATEAAAQRAVSTAAQQNLGLTADRVRRADLPRMLRTASADASFPVARGWEATRATLTGLDADPGPLPGAPPRKTDSRKTPEPPRIRIDAEPAAAKGVRPLALLVDPPADVRLSLRPAGGFEEQRALLHEGARAVGGARTQVARWELAQLGDGSAAEGVAQLFEQLAGHPGWLRETAQLRGETLDELVHTAAARRLLVARRAAALVLFEVRRREGPQTPEATAALYRGLLQRATRALFSDSDAGRWPLETDTWLRAAVTLRAALLAAQLEARLGAAPGAPGAAAKAGSAAAAAGAAPTATAEGTAPSPWWRSPSAAATLQRIWQGGRSLRAEEAALLAGGTLDPAALAKQVDVALSYAAPDPRPAAQRPDYKYMQGDRKVRRKRRKKH